MVVDMRFSWSILCIWLFTSGAFANSPKQEKLIAEELEERICLKQTTCKACIAAATECTWCAADLNINRCDTRVAHIASGCNDTDIIDPVHNMTIVEGKDTSDGKNAIQITPQRIKLRVRPHQTVEIPFEYYLAKDSPVDMYFLMDLSYTMKDYIKQLANVSRELVRKIQKITRKLNVGIGSFIDKVLLPYTEITAAALQNPCRTEGLSCKRPYNFKQIIELTENHTQFSAKLDGLENLMSANMDNPEGGLEAMLQAIVCGTKIGWRPKSRKLIIYCSDASFHYAGDGKLGGVVIPNDGECHLHNNMYTKAESQDYPSIGHLAEKIQKNKVTVIFAVAGEDKLELYKNLKNSLSGAYVSKLDSRGNSIDKIVRDNYNNITSGIVMETTDKTINMTFKSNCNGTRWIKGNSCDGIKLGQTVRFKAVITAPNCTGPTIKTININPVGVHDTLKIDLEIICDCDCKSEPKSPKCSNNGTLKCGRCVCDDGMTGNKCECSKEEDTKLNDRCIYPETKKLCNGQGTCNCGVCICDQMKSNRKHMYSGKYCQCDDYVCPNYKSKLCGGPTHGICSCGKCICKTGYKGESCRCPTSNENCRSKNNKICNGNGECNCGTCDCNPKSGYTGKTCEDCPACPTKCTIFKNCVKCVLKKNDVDSIECKTQCRNSDVKMVDKLDPENNDTRLRCDVEFHECFVNFLTISENGVDSIQIRKKQDCTAMINVTLLVAGIIIGILFLGIFLLACWKCITVYYDRREMARFDKEEKKRKWLLQQNPLYEAASTSYENPMLGKDI